MILLADDYWHVDGASPYAHWVDKHKNVLNVLSSCRAIKRRKTIITNSDIATFNLWNLLLRSSDPPENRLDKSGSRYLQSSDKLMNTALKCKNNITNVYHIKY